MKYFPLNLWHRLTRPVTTAVDELYQEYIARVVITIIALTAGFLTVVTFIGLIIRSVEFEYFVIILLIDAVSLAGIYLAMKGKWKLASIVPVGMFMCLGLYSIWTGFFASTGLLATVTSLLLIGLLGSPRATVVFVVWIVAIYNLVPLITGRMELDNLFSGIVSLLFMFSGIAFLQWLGITQLQVSLKKSVDLGHDLQREIEEHEVTHAEKLKLFNDYQFLFKNIQNDVFRVTKTEDGEITLQVFEGNIANRFQITTEKIAGKKLSQIISGDSYQAVKDSIDRAFAGENLHINRQIGDFYYTIILTPVKMDGVIREVVGALFDTTETSILERDTKLFEQKMRLFIDQNPMGVIELDPQGKIIQWNHSAEKIFGYQADEISGSNGIEQIILPNVRRKILRLINKIKKQQTSERMVVECITKEGAPLLCEWVFNPLSMEDRTLDGLIILVQDITEKQLSASLQLAIYKISNAANKTRTLQELFDAVHSIIAEMISARNFYIALHDPVRNGFEFVYHRDEVDENPQFVPSGKGLTDYVLRTGEPALVDPARFDELVASGDVENRGTPSVDWLGVPLKDDSNRAFGVIVLQTYSEGERYTQKHLDILKFVSTQISNVILKNRALDQLRESEGKYRNFIEQTNDAVILADEDGRIIDANQSIEDLSGMSREEIMGAYAWDLQYQLLPADKKTRVSYENLKRLFLNRVFTQDEKDINLVFNIEVQRADQSRRYVQESLFSFKSGKKYHVGVIARDITQLKETEENLRMSEERYRSFLENQGEGSIFVDTLENFTYANPAAESMFGVEPGQLIGMNFNDFLSPDQMQLVLDQTQLRVRGQKTSYELEITLKNKMKKTLLITATPQLTPTGQYLGAFSLFRDITERKYHEDQLRFYSMHDALTKIHNRAYFDTESVRIQSSGILPVAVLIIDVDDLKKVNDKQGHQVGDELLIQTAKLLKSSIRKSDLVARIGGDEFVIVLMEATKTDAVKVKRKITDQMESHNQSHPDLPIHVSIGVSIAEDHFDQAMLVKLADERMLKEKTKKKLKQYRRERGME